MGPDSGCSPDQVRSDLQALFATDPQQAQTIVFDWLAAEPRVKPTRGLIIDPGDAARQKWECRVAAAAALAESSVDVSAEFADELADHPDLLDDVLDATGPLPALEARCRRRR